jgi:hypothetical protein
MRALRILGKKERLAAALDVTLADLDAYLTGEKKVPNTVFIAALDIVATHKPGDRPVEE